MHKRKINIIINRPRTGSQNLFLMTTINEISNPDESYMGTLNLQFREFIQDDEQDEDMISQYTNIYNAIENGNRITEKQKSSNNLQYQNYLTN